MREEKWGGSAVGEQERKYMNGGDQTFCAIQMLFLP